MSGAARINGFDALRTIAMWLGIVLHAIIAYKIIPEPGWPQDPKINLAFFDWLYMYIHIFRMPLFFLVAGFFARLVIMRSGLKYFIIQRYKRIFIPLVIGIIVIVPVTMMPFHFYNFFNLQGMTADEAWRKTAGLIFSWNGLAHLWFLYYLIIFYILTLIIFLGIKKIEQKFRYQKKISIENISLQKLLFTIIVLFSILYFNNAAIPPVYTGVKPHVFHILYYGFFYLCGWLIQTNMKSIYSLQKNAGLFFIIGTCISVFQFYKPVILLPVVELLLTAIQTIMIVAGLTGLFMKYFHAESKIWRYCSDAAYWVYLIHMGIVAGLQVLLLNSSVFPPLRLPIILIITFILCLLSYQFLVRYTFIGEYLHGKRDKQPKTQQTGSKKILPIFFKKL